MLDSSYALFLTFTTTHLGKVLMCPFSRKWTLLSPRSVPSSLLVVSFDVSVVPNLSNFVQSCNRFSWSVHWWNQCNLLIVSGLGWPSLTVERNMFSVIEIMEWGLAHVILNSAHKDPNIKQILTIKFIDLSWSKKLCLYSVSLCLQPKLVWAYKNLAHMADEIVILKVKEVPYLSLKERSNVVELLIWFQQHWI